MKIVDENLAFITKDGQKLYSIVDLLLWLYFCNDEYFKYHVNENENHFYNWIKDVMGDKILAEKLRNVKDKEEMIRILKKYIFDIKNIKVEKESEIEVLLDFVKTFIKE